MPCEYVSPSARLRAWRHLGRMDPAIGSVRSWLLSITRNLSVDAWRRNARETPISEPPDTALPDSVDELLISEVMGPALARIGDRHRAVLHQTYYSGLSVAETAQTLGIAEGTVKSRTFYGLRALRSALEEIGLAELR